MFRPPLEAYRYRRKGPRRAGRSLLLSESDIAGPYIIASRSGACFRHRHSEYDRDTLANEYHRDISKGLPIRLPVRYFPGDDPSGTPLVCWRSHANLLFVNWLNYFVYQATPYNISDIGEVNPVRPPCRGRHIAPGHAPGFRSFPAQIPFVFGPEDGRRLARAAGRSLCVFPPPPAGASSRGC